MKYGMTGTRKGMTDRQRETFLYALKTAPRLNHLVHGDCIGADTDAHNVAVELKHEITIRPCDLPDQRAFSKAATIYDVKRPLDRNHDIVDDCALVFAFPSGYEELTRGSGTWATIRYARKKGVRLYIIYPNGQVSS